MTPMSPISHGTGHLTDRELLLFLDGESSPRAADRTCEHLEACADCRDRHLALQKAAASFIALHHATLDPTPPAVDAARATLQARLQASQQSTPRLLFGRFTRRTAFVYAAAAAIVLSITALNRDALFARLHTLPPQSEARLRPDSGLTPGATRPVGLDDICVQQPDAPEDPADLDPAVSPNLKKVVFQEYGMGDSQANDYQLDYLINPQLGGTDDVRNLWPEPYQSKVWNARAKDALESRLHAMVCSRQIDLASAQREIATDWIAAYKKYVRKANPA